MKSRLSIALITILVGGWLMPANGVAGYSASANGKYYNLIQKLTCASDRARYGEYRDYGYWSGGRWCGRRGKAGYWVWVNPNWYVWSNKGVPARASANGKYSRLIQTIYCPKDKGSYGRYTDYGYWGGGPWCGQRGEAGHWVWVAPHWYVWGVKN